MYSVYTLLDPVTRDIRYVGVTRHRVEQRLAAHLRDVRRGGTTHRAQWLRSLECEPKWKTLATFTDKSDAGEAERLWINYLREIGCDLTNHAAGGFTWPQCVNAKKTSTGRLHTEESRSALSDGMRRYWAERARREGFELRSEERRRKGREYQRAWREKKRGTVSVRPTI